MKTKEKKPRIVSVSFKFSVPFLIETEKNISFLYSRLIQDYKQKSEKNREPYRRLIHLLNTAIQMGGKLGKIYPVKKNQTEFWLQFPLEAFSRFYEQNRADIIGFSIKVVLPTKSKVNYCTQPPSLSSLKSYLLDSSAVNPGSVNIIDSALKNKAYISGIYSTDTDLNFCVKFSQLNNLKAFLANF